MTERMYGGYPESCVRDGLFQLEGEQVIAIVRDLLAENAALRVDAEELANALRDVLAGHPVRNADELIARYSPPSQGTDSNG